MLRWVLSVDALGSLYAHGKNCQCSDIDISRPHGEDDLPGEEVFVNHLRVAATATHVTEGALTETESPLV